ncbi:MAG: hypothetical protein RBG13Loki_0791 [Promethearchaeota archaeon CR_4]|nr:MAG: hypothetical protein RBG13Loki_0791 [Candidatus Lokiarchaeota archaeon CR_4]
MEDNQKEIIRGIVAIVITFLAVFSPLFPGWDDTIKGIIVGAATAIIPVYFALENSNKTAREAKNATLTENIAKFKMIVQIAILAIGIIGVIAIGLSLTINIVDIVFLTSLVISLLQWLYGIAR